VEEHCEIKTMDLGGTAKLPIAQWISITALIVTLAFNLSSRLTESDRTANDLAKLQADVVEMRKQMANREDLRELDRVVERLEIQVATLTDRLEHPK
jgi:hypothetical protein